MKARCQNCGNTSHVYECVKCKAFICNPCSTGGNHCPKCKGRQCMRPTGSDKKDK